MSFYKAAEACQHFLRQVNRVLVEQSTYKKKMTMAALHICGYPGAGKSHLGMQIKQMAAELKKDILVQDLDDFLSPTLKPPQAKKILEKKCHAILRNTKAHV